MSRTDREIAQDALDHISVLRSHLTRGDLSVEQLQTRRSFASPADATTLSNASSTSPRKSGDKKEFTVDVMPTLEIGDHFRILEATSEKWIECGPEQLIQHLRRPVARSAR